ncbi:MAG TPA: ABC transporter permease [Terriglobia bacterium]|nr:ABC transporter permease [Terriglobia bacterium]
MAFTDLLLDTFRTLWSHKLRTFLSMFGIAWGMVSIILMVAAGEGLRVGQQKQMRNFGKDIMIIFSGRTSMQAGGMRAGRAISWWDSDASIAAQEAPACEYVLPELESANTPIRSRYNNASLLVVGSLPPFAEIRSVDVEKGRFYGWGDQHHARRVAFLGSEAKKQLFATRPALHETVWIQNLPYTVVGIMRGKDQNNSYDGFDVNKVYIPFAAMRRDFPPKPPALPNTVGHLLATPRSVKEDDACKWQLRRALGSIHRFDPRDREAAHIWDTVEEARNFQAVVEGMKYFLGAVGLATLLLGGLGVMNVMLVAVRERTREIGVRKAVGATSRGILSQFFVESMIVVFLSGGIGMGVAYGLCALVDRIPMPTFFAGLLPSWQASLLAFGLLGAIAVASALYPARRAASIDPIEALRYEAGG